MNTRWVIKLAYEGSNFSGWQIQPDVRTVQGELNRALELRFGKKIETMGQGRTDAGVHAAAQVVHVDLTEPTPKPTPEPISERDRHQSGIDGLMDSESRLDGVRNLCRGIQSFLPSDIQLLGMQPVADDFHARFDALRRCYRYLVFQSGSPFLDRVGWRVQKSPDIGVLQKMASEIIGEHDFINFCIPPKRKDATTLCRVHRSEWSEVLLGSAGDFLPVLAGGRRHDETRGHDKTKGVDQFPRMWIYTVEADRFLHHMVRRLVGTMIRMASFQQAGVRSGAGSGKGSGVRSGEGSGETSGDVTGKMIGEVTDENSGEKSGENVRVMEEWKSLLRAEPAIRKGFTAPACGLTLMHVDYPGEIF